MGVLRITLHDSVKTTTFKLEGKLAGAWVRELELAWVTASSASGGRKLVVDLAQVDFIDAAGKELLARMHAGGAGLLPGGPWSRAVVEQIARAATALAVAALLLVGGKASAQEPVRLSLREAVTMALKQNPQVRIAALNFAQAQEEILLTRSGLLPQAGVRTFEEVRRFNLEALIGGGFPAAQQHVGPFLVFQASAGFSAPLLDLTLWRRWRASQQAANAAGAQENTAREQVASLVISQYLGALRASADVDAARSRVDLAQALYNQALDLQNAGVGTGVDTLRANVQLQAEKQRLIGSRTVYQTALFGLGRLLNLDPSRPVELTDAVSFFETPPITVDQSLAAAYASRPELRALRFREQAVELERKAAEAERYPSLRFDGTWGYQGLRSPREAIPAYTYTVALNLPLFTGGRIRAETARARQELEITRQQTQDVRNAVAFEVKSAAMQLEAARSEVEVANLGVKLAREEVAQARDRFQAGVANNIEVVTAQDALARANDNQIGALYRYNQARADLARATGQVENLYAR